MNENALPMKDSGETNDSASARGATHYAERLTPRIGRLYRRLCLLWLAFIIVAAIATPADIISQLTVAVMMAVVYGLTALAASRFRLLADTAPLTKTVLIFLFSVALTLLVLFGL